MIRLIVFTVLITGTQVAYAGLGTEILKGIGKAVSREAGQEAAEASGRTATKELVGEIVEAGGRQSLRRGGVVLLREAGEQFGRGIAGTTDDVARGLGGLSAKSSRRLAMLSDEINATGKGGEIMQLISRGGKADQVVDFLWRSKGTLIGGAAVTTLLMNPNAVLGASSELAGSVLEMAGTNVMQPLIERSPFIGSIALLFPLLFLAIVALLIVWAAFSRSSVSAWCLTRAFVSRCIAKCLQRNRQPTQVNDKGKS